MQHKHVTQFYTTCKYTRILELEGHVFIYNNVIGTLFQDQSGMIFPVYVFLKTAIVLLVTSTRPFGGELFIILILL